MKDENVRMRRGIETGMRMVQEPSFLSQSFTLELSVSFPSPLSVSSSPFFSRHDQHIARHPMLVITSACRITIFVLNVVFR